MSDPKKQTQIKELKEVMWAVQQEEAPKKAPQPLEMVSQLRTVLEEVARNPSLPPARIEQCQQQLVPMFAAFSKAMEQFQEFVQKGAQEAKAVEDSQKEELQKLEKLRTESEKKQAAEDECGPAKRQGQAGRRGHSHCLVERSRQRRAQAHGSSTAPPPGSR